MAADLELRLEPWDDRGPELERRANIPEMTTYLGGPESEESILARHRRILDTVESGAGRMFLIMIPGETDPVGSVGYWDKEWQGATVYEMGWKVLSTFQGRGLAVAGTVAAIGLAAAEGRHPWAHAYPRVDNAPSNAVCRKAGFTLLGESDFEYPKGNPIRCNDWRYDLTSLSGSVSGSGSAAGSGSTSRRA
jgi:RimJ/RimL family protein N-acetyltransferase